MTGAGTERDGVTGDGGGCAREPGVAGPGGARGGSTAGSARRTSCTSWRRRPSVGAARSARCCGARGCTPRTCRSGAGTGPAEGAGGLAPEEAWSEADAGGPMRTHRRARAGDPGCAGASSRPRRFIEVQKKSRGCWGPWPKQPSIGETREHGGEVWERVPLTRPAVLRVPRPCRACRGGLLPLASSPTDSRHPVAARALSSAERTGRCSTSCTSPNASWISPPRRSTPAARRGDATSARSRTMYRILAEHGEVRERRDQLRHPAVRPELLATAPNQVWCWDITKLTGPAQVDVLLPLRDPGHLQPLRRRLAGGRARGGGRWPAS